MSKERILKIRLRDVLREADSMGLSMDSLFEGTEPSKMMEKDNIDRQKYSRIRRFIAVYVITFPVSFLIFFKQIPYDSYLGRNWGLYLDGTIRLSLLFNCFLSLSVYWFITRLLPWYRLLRSDRLRQKKIRKVSR
jgi:hypothetical protein